MKWIRVLTVIKWFTDIQDKHNCSFSQFDIVEFYPSISNDLLLKEIKHAKKYVPISKKEIETIMHARKSLLFGNNSTWIKKGGNTTFDVTMGSFDGAEICELVGLFILYCIGEIFEHNYANTLGEEKC